MNDISNNTDFKLSPPWYTFANKVKNTYGLSDLIQVNDLINLGSTQILVINTFNNEVAYALRQILPLTVKMGNIEINLVIFDCNGQIVPLVRGEYTSEEVSELFNEALKGNPLFIKTILTDGLLDNSSKALIGDVVVVIAKEVIQFFNDDISELCNNFNDVAANVFKEITRNEFEPNKVGFSTYDPNCKYKK